MQEALSKNDSTLEFDSPAVDGSPDLQSLRTFLHLDNAGEELKGFKYHLDPTFDHMGKKVITETGIIIVTVRITHSPSACAHARAILPDLSLPLALSLSVRVEVSPKP